MKKKNLILLSSLLSVFFLLSALTCAAAKPELQDIRYNILSPTSEQVILQLNGAYSPKVSILNDPPRIVFDFPGMVQSKKVVNIKETKGTIVKGIRVAMHTGGETRTRVVFDLFPLKGVKHTQQFDEQSQTLTVHFHTSQAADNKQAAQEQTALPVQDTADGKIAATSVKTQASPAIEEKTTKPVKDQKSSSAPADQKSKKADVDSDRAKDSQDVKEQKTLETPPANSQTSEPPSVAAQTDKSAGRRSPFTPIFTPADTTPAEQTAPKTEPEKKEKDAVPPVESEKSSTVSVKPATPLLESVTFDGASPKGEMVLFKLSGFYPPLVHAVEEGTPRVICDFNDARMSESIKSPIKTKGKYIKIIRVTRHKDPEKIRVIVDLAPEKSYDLQQVFFKEDNLFVLIVNETKK